MAKNTDKPLQTTQAPRRRGFFVRFVRFVAWVLLAISGLSFASLVYSYAPCFMGVPNTCASGLLLLFGGVFALAFGGVGILAIYLTRSRFSDASE